MARSPRTKAEIQADPTVAWNPSIDELNATMQPKEVEEQKRAKLINDLGCINQRATVMINHFAPMLGVAASDMENMLNLIEHGHDMSEDQLAAYVEGVRRNIQKVQDAKDRLAQRANEIANIADLLSKDQDGTN